MDQDLAFRLLLEAGEHVQDGGFAAAAGAEQAEEIASFDPKVEIPERPIVKPRIER